MTTYRTGNHHGVTIVAEPTGDPEMFCCNLDDHDHARGRLVAVVVKGDRELAERICALLNLPDAPGAAQVSASLATQTAQTGTAGGNGRAEAQEGAETVEPLRLNGPMVERLRRCAADTSGNWGGQITIYPPEARELVALIDLAELNRRAAEHTEVCR